MLSVSLVWEMESLFIEVSRAVSLCRVPDRVSIAGVDIFQNGVRKITSALHHGCIAPWFSWGSKATTMDTYSLVKPPILRTVSRLHDSFTRNLGELLWHAIPDFLAAITTMDPGTGKRYF